MFRILIALCAFVLLVGSGIAQRLWNGAWISSDEPAASAALLADVPMTIGDWKGEEMKMNERQLKAAEVVGHLARRYVLQKSAGKEVMVLIVCGRPGPISVHPPDVCFTSAGFYLQGDRSSFKKEGVEGMPDAEFIKMDMAKSVPEGSEQLRLYWSFKARGPWCAPRFPRWTFGRSAALYKLYLVYTPPSRKLGEKDPCPEFMNDFLPALEKALSKAS